MQNVGFVGFFSSRERSSDLRGGLMSGFLGEVAKTRHQNPTFPDIGPTAKPQILVEQWAITGEIAGSL